MLPHPLLGPLQAWGPAVFVPSLLLTLGLAGILHGLDLPLRAAARGRGIVHLELAGSWAEARAIVNAWGARGRSIASFATGLDYLFLLAYSATVSMACLWASSAAGEAGWPFPELGTPLAWGLLLAATLDAVENLALLMIIIGPRQGRWPAVARWCAIPKFALVVAGLLFTTYGGLAWILSRA